MLTVLDLFSGFGGFSLGLESTGGFETIAFCEIEKYPQKVLKKHWSNVPLFDDVVTLDKGLLSQSGIESVDLICGGFPCQDVSIAGTGEGIDGKRSGLWKEFKRIIGEVGPRWVIIENVPVLRTRGLVTVLQDLWEVGYDAQWHCVPASAIGALHRRERLWIIAHTYGQGLQRQRYITESIKQEITKSRGACRWAIEPGMGRVAHGIPNRVDRIKGLGNAIVPQMVEIIGRAILEIEKDCHGRSC